MKVTEMDSIEPGNPFLSDSYNMGFSLGTNVTVMYGNFANQFMRYLIVVDTTTGERIRITFEE